MFEVKLKVMTSGNIDWNLQLHRVTLMVAVGRWWCRGNPSHQYRWIWTSTKKCV